MPRGVDPIWLGSLSLLKALQGGKRVMLVSVTRADAERVLKKYVELRPELKDLVDDVVIKGVYDDE